MHWFNEELNLDDLIMIILMNLMKKIMKIKILFHMASNGFNNVWLKHSKNY